MKLKLKINRIRLKESIRFLVLAALIGLFAVAFAKSCELAFAIFLWIFHHAGYWILVIIPAGSFSISYLIKNYFPEAEGSGIPQALAISHTDNLSQLNHFFIPKVILSKFIFVTLGTAIGATIGREGPTVQIGATLMTLGQKKLTAAKRKLLWSIGAAAGLGAAFNTPLGGVVFIFEELAKGLSLRSLSLIRITGVATAGVVAMLFAGNYSYYGLVSRHLLTYNWQIFIVAIIIGIFAALNNFIFGKLIFYTTISPTSWLNNWRKYHPYLNSLVCGLLIAVLGLISAGLSFGNGYVESRAALNNEQVLPHLYYLYKMFGSLFSTTSGIPGGYFATSLAIGNGIGNFVYHIFAVANMQQYCLLGMVAFLAALTQAPVTAIVMVLQITSSQIFSLPVIIAALTATWIAQLLDKSIYEYQIEEYLHR
jgi:H+/Cl- antiporter ClcA